MPNAIQVAAALRTLAEWVEQIEARLANMEPDPAGDAVREVLVGHGAVLENPEGPPWNDDEQKDIVAAPVQSLVAEMFEEKPPAQVIETTGVDHAKTSGAQTSALPPALEKTLSVVKDPAFQAFAQTKCDHPIDLGEHPLRHAARVILSVCCIASPYELAWNQEAADRLKALMDRFRGEVPQ